MTTTIEITLDALLALRAEAAAHGDLEQVRLCEVAQRGDQDAIRKCAEVLASARALDDGE